MPSHRAEAPREIDLPSTVRAAVDAPDRTKDDRALDAGRHPAELLAFAGIRPGMRVGELGAGGGYTTELLARVVGPNGVVYAQNSRLILDRFAEKPWSERLAKPVMANVVRVDRVDRAFDDPLPPEARNLDAVLIVLFYHDTVWMGVDRKRMNQTVFAALKPGRVRHRRPQRSQGIGCQGDRDDAPDRAVDRRAGSAGGRLPAGRRSALPPQPRR